MNTIQGRVSGLSLIVLIVFRVSESKPFSKKPNSEFSPVANHIVASKLTILNGREAKFIYGVRTDPKSAIKIRKVLIPLSQAVSSSSSSSSSSESGSGSISGSGSSSESKSIETKPKIHYKVEFKKIGEIAAVKKTTGRRNLFGLAVKKETKS